MEKKAFLIPVFLHIYAMISIFALGVTKAIWSCAIVAVLHSSYLFFVYRKIKKQSIRHYI